MEALIFLGFSEGSRDRLFASSSPSDNLPGGVNSRYSARLRPQCEGVKSVFFTNRLRTVFGRMSRIRGECADESKQDVKVRVGGGGLRRKERGCLWPVVKLT